MSDVVFHDCLKSNLIFKIEQKSFPRQLLMQIPLLFDGSSLFPDLCKAVIIPLLHDVENIPDCKIRLKRFFK